MRKACLLFLCLTTQVFAYFNPAYNYMESTSHQPVPLGGKVINKKTGEILYLASLGNNEVGLISRQKQAIVQEGVEPNAYDDHLISSIFSLKNLSHITEQLKHDAENLSKNAGEMSSVFPGMMTLMTAFIGAKKLTQGKKIAYFIFPLIPLVACGDILLTPLIIPKFIHNTAKWKHSKTKLRKAITTIASSEQQTIRVNEYIFHIVKNTYIDFLSKITYSK